MITSDWDIPNKPGIRSILKKPYDYKEWTREELIEGYEGLLDDNFNKSRTIGSIYKKLLWYKSRFKRGRAKNLKPTKK